MCPGSTPEAPEKTLDAKAFATRCREELGVL
jgi:hypothetical protein